jgi:hypothetical protein
VALRRFFYNAKDAFSAPLRFFLTSRLPQEKAKRLFDDGKVHLLANQPFAPRDGPEDKVHDRPEQAVMDVVPDHGGGQGKEQINKSGQFKF